MKAAVDTAAILTAASAVQNADSKETVFGALAALSAKQGFDGFLYGARFALGSTRHTDFIMSNYDAGWRQEYDTAGFALIDPTVGHAVTSVAPLVWTIRRPGNRINPILASISLAVCTVLFMRVSGRSDSILSAFVVLSFLGGLAIPLYLAGWLLIPEEGAELSVAEELLARERSR